MKTKICLQDRTPGAEDGRQNTGPGTVAVHTSRIPLQIKKKKNMFTLTTACMRCYGSVTPSAEPLQNLRQQPAGEAAPLKKKKKKKRVTIVMATRSPTDDIHCI